MARTRQCGLCPPGNLKKYANVMLHIRHSHKDSGVLLFADGSSTYVERNAVVREIHCPRCLHTYRSFSILTKHAKTCNGVVERKGRPDPTWSKEIALAQKVPLQDAIAEPGAQRPRLQYPSRNTHSVQANTRPRTSTARQLALPTSNLQPHSLGIQFGGNTHPSTLGSSLAHPTDESHRPAVHLPSYSRTRDPRLKDLHFRKKTTSTPSTWSLPTFISSILANFDTSSLTRALYASGIRTPGDLLVLSRWDKDHKLWLPLKDFVVRSQPDIKWLQWYALQKAVVGSRDEISRYTTAATTPAPGSMTPQVSQQSPIVNFLHGLARPLHHHANAFKNIGMDSDAALDFVCELSTEDWKIVEKVLVQGGLSLFGCLLVREGLEQRKRRRLLARSTGGQGRG